MIWKYLKNSCLTQLQKMHEKSWRKLTVWCSHRRGQCAANYSHVGGQHTSEAPGCEVQERGPPADPLQGHLWWVIEEEEELNTSDVFSFPVTDPVALPVRLFLTDHFQGGGGDSVERHSALAHPRPEPGHTVHVLWGDEEEGGERREEGERGDKT